MMKMFQMYVALCHDVYIQVQKLLLNILDWSSSTVTSAVTWRGGDTAFGELRRLVLVGDFRTAANDRQEDKCIESLITSFTRTISSSHYEYVANTDHIQRLCFIQTSATCFSFLFNQSTFVGISQLSLDNKSV